jgi:choline dehydrogenase
LHSPQILELSGIGSTAILEAAGIDVLHALPGVGANFQDHPLIHIDYPYTNTSLTTPYTVLRHGDTAFNFQYNADAHNTALNTYLASKTGPLTAIPSNALAFPSLPQISAPVSSLVASASSDSRYYPSNYDATLQSGYEAQLTSLLSRLALTTTPAFENLNNNAGGLDVSLQHPLSRGTVHITSSAPFTPPAIDPRWLTNPFDRSVMVLAMQFNQRILDTPAIQELQPSYPSIPRDASTEVLSAALDDSVATEYHYSGTCAMMPLGDGGVVDTELRVYGTGNLRVVDTSVFPLVPTAHLSAVVYAVAEKVISRAGEFFLVFWLMRDRLRILFLRRSDVEDGNLVEEMRAVGKHA